MHRVGAGDHPRSRGEHVVPSDHRPRILGPSSLARGAPDGDRRPEAERGTIPARAGSTRAAAVAEKDLTDHPRSRGEHGGPAVGADSPQGPSPLARGARCRARTIGGPERTIPARAGSTSVRLQRTRSSRDHPRSRGEHKLYTPLGNRWAGPSPLARGARFHPEHPGPLPGDHPLARGAPFRCPEHVFFVGTIPARAGSTSEAVVSSMLVRDHPRSRGEHALILGGGGLQRWTIPARAGSTLPAAAPVDANRDHPRSRGEHTC